MLAVLFLNLRPALSPRKHTGVLNGQYITYSEEGEGYDMRPLVVAFCKAAAGFGEGERSKSERKSAER